jgi:hypothetical protein
MAKYLLSVHTGQREVREPMTPEEMRRGFELVNALESELKATDALVFSGRLEGPDAARVVRPAKHRVRTTDGPYAETKEHLGGFYIIDALDLDAALAWASKVTVAINAPIEVRAFEEDPRG